MEWLAPTILWNLRQNKKCLPTKKKLYCWDVKYFLRKHSWSLRKQPTFGNATTGFPAKWRLRNERRNSTLMTGHYPDLGSASAWLNQISHAAWPIRRTTQIWVVTCHQYEISALVSQKSFGGETSGSVAKCWLFSQASAVEHSSNPIQENNQRNLLAPWESHF